MADPSSFRCSRVQTCHDVLFLSVPPPATSSSAIRADFHRLNPISRPKSLLSPSQAHPRLPHLSRLALAVPPPAVSKGAPFLLVPSPSFSASEDGLSRSPSPSPPAPKPPHPPVLAPELTLDLPPTVFELANNQGVAGLCFDVYERSEQGQRPSQEDTIAIKFLDDQRLLVGVFDGHGGRAAADFCKEHCLECISKHLPSNPLPWEYRQALAHGIRDAEEQFLSLAERDGLEDGTTVLVACITPDTVHVAHCGDSRATILRANHAFMMLTQDHRSTLPREMQRVFSVGGTVEVCPDGCPRILPGGYAFSRSLGDRFGKDRRCPVLSAIPDVNTVRIEPDMRFLILACDGVWDVLTSKMCAELAEPCATARAACDAIVEAALRLGSADNVSALVVRLF